MPLWLARQHLYRKNRAYHG